MTDMIKPYNKMCKDMKKRQKRVQKQIGNWKMGE